MTPQQQARLHKAHKRLLAALEGWAEAEGAHLDEPFFRASTGTDAFGVLTLSMESLAVTVEQIAAQRGAAAGRRGGRGHADG